MNPDQQKKRDDLSFGRTEPTDINPEKQGISNRPGAEEPDSGVDRKPGPLHTKRPEDASK